MSKEYIEREEVRDAFYMEFDEDYADDIVDRLPTADVQEVVRCKDCIFGKYDDDLNMILCKRIYNLSNGEYVYNDLNDFCSYGAKMDKERYSMTPQEALKIRNNPHFNDVDNQALSTCIDEALEKQIPKKPIYEDVGNIYGALKRTCPNCGDVCIVTKRAIPFEHYCRYCGQALDWSETE